MAVKDKERRAGWERREREKPEVASTRGRERRTGDRRESPRIPIPILVRQVSLGGSFEERRGDIAVGGVYFEERYLPHGTRVELRFRLPGIESEVRCEGEIVRVSGAEGRYGAHVRFVDLPTAVELAIARHIDELALRKRR